MMKMRGKRKRFNETALREKKEKKIRSRIKRVRRKDIKIKKDVFVFF